MATRSFLKSAIFTLLLAAGIVPILQAGDAEFRYTRPIGGRAMTWSPRESYAVVGGHVYFFSTTPQPQPPAPNQWLNFRHPYTHAYVSVPVALPDGTPRIERRLDRLIYDYGFVAVVIHFVRDGSVDVFYNQKSNPTHP